MAAESEFRHRPGALKQQNKVHKTGRHRSKGQLNKSNKGAHYCLISCIDKRKFTEIFGLSQHMIFPRAILMILSCLIKDVPTFYFE